MTTENGTETIVVIGYGWVGQANALALSFMGYSVCYFDVGTPVLRYAKEWNKEYAKIRPLAHPLEQDSANTWYLVAVGDRVSDEGVQDISLIAKALEALRGAKGKVILRSTVLPEHLSFLRFNLYLPEFLHEQYAVEECLNPFLFVVGGLPLVREPEFLCEWEARAHKTFRGTALEASYVKYLSNIWNALRVSFINEMGDIISHGGEDRGSAARVIDFLFEGKAYLRYGKAYGGHCLPKDTLAFWRSHAEGESAALIRAIHDANERHKKLGTYHELPEWFSRWEREGGIVHGTLSRLWQKLNSISFVRSLRVRLRPIRRFVNRLAPRRSLKETKRLWNRLAAKNALYYSHPNTESGRKVGEYVFRESGKGEYHRYIASDAPLREAMGSFVDKAAIDLGSGAGRHAEFFAREFKEVALVDIAEEMLRAARKRLAGFPNTSFVPTDGTHLPLPDASADLIFSRQLLESLLRERDIESYVAEMFRVLRSGGAAKIELRTGAAPYRWAYTYGLSFTADEARSLFERAGFTVLSVTPEGTKHLWVTAVKP